MPYYGPRITPRAGRDPTQALVQAFQRIEERPVELAKRAAALQQADAAGVDVGTLPGVEEVPDAERRVGNDPAAPNRDRTRGSGYAGGADPETRQPVPEETPDFGFRPIPESAYPGGYPEQPRGAGPQEGPEAFAAQVGSQLEANQPSGPMVEGGGLPPGDVRAPTGTPGAGAEPRPGESPGRAAAVDYEQFQPPRPGRYRMRSGVEFSGAPGQPDYGGMIAAAFGEDPRQPRGRIRGEVAEEFPWAGQMMYGRESETRLGFNPSDEQLRGVGVPEQIVSNLPAMDAPGGQEQRREIYNRWAKPAPGTGGGINEEAKTTAVNQAMRLVQSGRAETFTEAAAMVAQARPDNYEPSAHDIADAMKANLGPARAMTTIYGTPDPNTPGQTYAFRLRQRGYAPEQIIERIETDPDLTEDQRRAMKEQASAFLTVDPTDLMTRRIMYGVQGGQ